MSRRLAYCTIASANYLSRVEVLLSSMKSQNPDAQCHVLLCEGPEEVAVLSQDTGIPFLSPHQVCPQWQHMAFYYDIIEFNTALKPFLIEHLFHQGYDAVIYLDPDIEIFGSLQSIEDLLDTYDLVLTPHICRPLAIDGHKPAIDDIVRAGQFNLGFVGLAASSDSLAALSWWQEVCTEHCLFHARHRFFVDQFWADILPSFIQEFHCLRDPGCNMAYWNVFQRQLRHENGRWLADGGDLRFFHFSGLSKEDLTLVSIHQNRVTAPPGSPLHELLSHYGARLVATDWHRYSGRPYSFATYDDGLAIQREDRKKFLMLSKQERDSIGNPFAQPLVVRSIKKIDFEDLDPRHLIFGLRVRRWLHYGKQLYREFRSSLRRRGLLLTVHVVARFLSRGLNRTFKNIRA